MWAISFCSRTSDLAEVRSDLLDVGLELGANLLDLFLQAQLGLPQMALRGKVRQVRIALFQALDGLGNDARTGALVGGGDQSFVEGDVGGHGRIMRCEPDGASAPGPVDPVSRARMAVRASHPLSMDHLIDALGGEDAV